MHRLESFQFILMLPSQFVCSTALYFLHTNPADLFICDMVAPN